MKAFLSYYGLENQPFANIHQYASLCTKYVEPVRAGHAFLPHLNLDHRWFEKASQEKSKWKKAADSSSHENYPDFFAPTELRPGSPQFKEIDTVDATSNDAFITSLYHERMSVQPDDLYAYKSDLTREDILALIKS